MIWVRTEAVNGTVRDNLEQAIRLAGRLNCGVVVTIRRCEVHVTSTTAIEDAEADHRKMMGLRLKGEVFWPGTAEDEGGAG